MREKASQTEIYHVLNRGVDKRKIFLDREDYFRFIHDLFEFNDEKPAFNVGYFLSRTNNDGAAKYIDVRRQYIAQRGPRKTLVELMAFCLMPNHYHLLLRPKTETALSEFIKKVNGGYAKYFNARYERTGALFQGKYKSVRITHESHLLHLLYYIHLNPLDIQFPRWRDRTLTNHRAALKFLESYRWSSHLDYLGKKNFPSVTRREFFLQIFGGTRQYGRRISQWLREIDLKEIGQAKLE